jgi:small subunit ribosomal protein S6
MKRKYDIGFIINPETNEDDVKKIVDSVLDIIKNSDGTVENVDEWGRKKLAYPIEKHNEGIYVFMNAEMKGSVFFDIERRLKLSEKVMRFVIVRLDDKLKKANRLIKKWKKSEKLRKINEEKGEGSSSDHRRRDSGDYRRRQSSDSRRRESSSDAPRRKESAPAEAPKKKEVSDEK